MNQRQIIKGVITLLVVCTILFLVWYLSRVVIYILLSAVLAIIGRPLVKRLQRVSIKQHTLSRSVAAAITLLVMWVVAGGLFMLFMPLIIEKVNELAALDLNIIMGAVETPIAKFESAISRFMVASDFSIMDAVRDFFSQLIHINLLSTFTDAAGLLATAAISVFSVTFITFYFLKEEGLFYRIVALFFPERYRPNVYHALDSITALLSRYFGGLLVESMLLMAVISVVLLIAGMTFNNALIIGLIMGVMNLIPYAGPVIGAVVSLSMGIISPIDGDVAATITIIVVTILAVKLIDDFIIQPNLYSQRVQAHPLEVFLVILIAGYVAGMWGMMLAIPLYTVARVFAREFFSEYSLVRRLTSQMKDETE